MNDQPKHFPYLLDVEAYPDYDRRQIKVPSWSTFDNTTQMTTLRSFPEKNRKLVNFKKVLDDYTVRFGLGRMIWPVFPTVFAKNFDDLVDEIRKRKLFLFDIWGHVPGSSMEAMWNHVMPPPGMVEKLQNTLGERFLGIDNGEQDGRYVGGYTTQQCPSPQDRFRQYVNFQRHFERMCDDLGNHMTTLVSLCFGHYFLKEGNHALIGAETAQALPNSQVYYAFIRGAGKQYGVLWFGNASVFNRWGYKNYESSGISEGYQFGPEYGTSLVLLKRLLYTHYLYNCMAVGFEMGWVIEQGGQDMLSPIGRIQEAAGRFIAQHGQPGVMHTPVAFMLDFHAGWAMPRHLYTDNVYQVWGGMPYDEGDYFTHGLFSMIYPGYENSSYYRDERGFLSATPYGDMVDALLSDAPLWVMSQYAVIVIAGDLSDRAVNTETRDKLDRYIRNGGHVVVTAEPARRLWPEFGIEDGPTLPANSMVTVESTDNGELREFRAGNTCVYEQLTDDEILATGNAQPLCIRRKIGDGVVTLFLSPFGLNDEPVVSGPIPNEQESPLQCPYILQTHVQHILGRILRSQHIFSVGKDLGYITCRKESGQYTLGIYNNSLEPRPFNINSHCGRIDSITELETDTSERGAHGYWPAGMTVDRGVSSNETITAGDVRLFSVVIAETDLELIEPTVPPEVPRNRALLVHPPDEIKLSILEMPTYLQHFDSAMVDWRYIHRRSVEQIQHESSWIGRQRLRIIVDLSTGLNFYPDLTLLDTLKFRHDETLVILDDVLHKMTVLGARDLVLSLHRKPENHCTDERADERFLVGVRDLCDRAAKQDINLHIQHHPEKWFGTAGRMLSFVDEVNRPNLRLAMNTAHISMTGEDTAMFMAEAGNRLGAILVSAPSTDLLGQQYDAHLPLCRSDVDVSALASRPDDCLLILAAEYDSWDEVYSDLRIVEG